MRPELVALQQAFAQSQVAESFVKLAFLDLEPDSETALADSVTASLNRFLGCPEVAEKAKNIKDLSRRITVISEISPSFLLSIIRPLSGKPAETKRLLKLMVAVMDFLVINSISSQESRSALSSSIAKVGDLSALREKAKDSTGYLPGIIKHEMELITEVVNNFPDVAGRSERIEMLYFYRAATNVYYRIFYNALATSSSEAGSAHLNDIFSKFF